MTNILITEIGDNLGSLETIEFIPVDDVVSIPDAVSQVVTSAPTLAAYKSFYTMECTAGTQGYEEPQEQTENGPVYKKKIVAFIPKDTPELNAQFEGMENYKYICKIKDMNGAYKIVGSIAEPLFFRADMSTTTDVFGRAGHAVEFWCDSSHKSYNYEV